MRTDTAVAIGQLDSIAALVPALKHVVEDLQDTLRALDKDADKQQKPASVSAATTEQQVNP
jgi:hypothetical protein